MARMTEEEAGALDEYWTEHTPKLSSDGNSGFFAKHRKEASIETNFVEARPSPLYQPPTIAVPSCT
ncbi:MAG: hypothetical protein LBD08_02925 [Treponema sp.]|nr:hypothetical protein [Treponema sp.]